MGKAAVALVLFLLWPTEAGAELTCRPNNAMVQYLLDRGEIPLIREEEDSGHVIFTFSDPIDKTWTRVRRMYEEGRPYLCVIEAGQAGKAPPKAGKES